jgi:periplasmic divalent cation tolerance protein
MYNFIQIQWSCGNIDEARKVCRYLVQERLIACANIVPWVESIFLWDNQMDTAQETKVYLKTRADNFDAIEAIIKSNTSYEVPEILRFDIAGGNKEYLEWLKESCAQHAST